MNRNMTFIRLYYLFWLGAGGFIYPFISLFYKQQGLSGTQMGLLGTTASIIGLISAPLIGRLSDNVSHPRRVLQFCLIGSAILYLFLSQQYVFIWIALIIALDALIGAPIYPLSDAQALKLASNQKEGYGSIRLWGSLGWAITAFVGGWIVERTGLVSVFFGYAISYLCCALMLLAISTPRKPTEKSDAPHPKLKAVLQSLVRDRALIGLAFAFALFWLTGNGRQQFESLYMQHLGASERFIGLAYTYPALLEIPIMLWADRLMRRYGAGRLLAAALLIEALAMSIIVIHPTLGSILFMRLASSLYYSFYAVASIAYAAERAPAGQSATVLSLYFVTLGGIIALVASPISGMIFDRLGAYPLYIIAMLGAFGAWLILLLTQTPRNTNSLEVQNV
jgi:MFS transporter, PPP family, 3-phenylpropionic acid transporter